jgi:hypothetical protein
MQTHIFKIHLFYDKKIIREIEVPSNWSLYKLAEAVVGAYNFGFDHCFGFFSTISEHYYDSAEKYELFTDLEDQGIEPTGAGSVEKTKISEVWKEAGKKMLMLFDYGDSWMFVVEFIGQGKKENKIKYPRVLRRTGRAPKQY